MAKRQQQKSQDESASKTAETARDKFKRLASARMSKILDACDQLGNLATQNRDEKGVVTSGYDYNKEDVEKMQAAVRDKLIKVFARFAAPGSKVSKPRQFEI